MDKSLLELRHLSFELDEKFNNSLRLLDNVVALRMHLDTKHYSPEATGPLLRAMYAGIPEFAPSGEYSAESMMTKTKELFDAAIKYVAEFLETLSDYYEKISLPLNILEQKVVKANQLKYKTLPEHADGSKVDLGRRTMYLMYGQKPVRNVSNLRESIDDYVVLLHKFEKLINTSVVNALMSIGNDDLSNINGTLNKSYNLLGLDNWKRTLGLSKIKTGKYDIFTSKPYLGNKVLTLTHSDVNSNNPFSWLSLRMAVDESIMVSLKGKTELVRLKPREMNIAIDSAASLTKGLRDFNNNVSQNNLKRISKSLVTSLKKSSEMSSDTFEKVVSSTKSLMYVYKTGTESLMSSGFQVADATVHYIFTSLK